MTLQKNNIKILISVCIFLFLITIACSAFLLISKTKTTTSIVPIATSSAKTRDGFQTLITNFSAYIDLTDAEKETAFVNKNDGKCFWPGLITSESQFYSFVKALNQGSVKKLTVDKNNFKPLLGDYSFTFYTTPNYENWTNEQFTSKNFFPITRTDDFSPIYAYPSVLIWSDSLFCKKTTSDSFGTNADYTQCEILVKEALAAF